ncbi:transcription termination factor Rho [Nonomuraea muscovyensis]|uniref:Transcription termination factor Rho n=2 Tax=Nonomuraea muscovyensis TaxID=1124761 RepID=A0A7X0C6N0_9ACTN|nr:transcription termination factor Rho [Nonomuraea muscovyensis]MBB6348086.1 transcription termination factor Rho [Nonomuraea muscovyensis]
MRRPTAACRDFIASCPPSNRTGAHSAFPSSTSRREDTPMTTTTDKPAKRRIPTAAPAALNSARPAAENQEVTGVVDVRDHRVYLRASGYLPGEHDICLPVAHAKALGLRAGDLITARLRRPSGKSAEVVSIDHLDLGRQRLRFADMTPVHPQSRLLLETESSITRLIDLITPVGLGQRGLIAAPPKAGKTMALKAIADAIAAKHPAVDLMVVLVGERPEEVTDFRRQVRGEVIASTFDQPERDHTALAELAIERAKRLVERGRNVVVLLDSLTRLGRAYNVIAPKGGKTLTGGIDAYAVHRSKQLFGAARATEEGGSLTIVATALVETGSRMDDYLFEEFKSTGNMELRLDRALAEQRLFPAVDVSSSGTRREEMLLTHEEREIVWRLRQVLAGLNREQALTGILDGVRTSPSNAAYLRKLALSQDPR